MPEFTHQKQRKEGRDATHRASNLDTHLTHGCILLFRHFWRVQSECAEVASFQSRAIAAFSASALRTRMGGQL